ncbi:MAG: dTDP-glucose 4,6-dehydratase [Patescibacteria group bacterium]
MKILITGGAGFIGSNFVHHVAQKYRSYEIFVLDKLTYAGNLDNLSALVNEERFHFIHGDIADKEFLRDFFETVKPDMVVNFAAETHVDRSIIEPSIFVLTNVVGTQNLLELSLEHKVKRYHQISTDEVYGDLGDGSTNYFTETTPIDPNCPYAASKASSDLLVSSFHRTYGFPATISRCSNNYGPYQFPEKLIPYFFQLAKQDKPLPLYGDGKNVRDWLYVPDHCEAIDLILHRSDIGKIYNIGGHNEKNNLEIARVVLKFLDKSEDLLTFIEDRRAHDRRYAMDPSLIEAELGWHPSVSFEEGIQKTFEWYELNEPWWRSIVEKHSITESRTHLSSRSTKSGVTVQ